ncbi:MAG: hypothetical protein LH629_15980, partial [Ignavibacteria bacterium]|nr:hypothetical protein [Ignavibacteria bacterium]
IHLPRFALARRADFKNASILAMKNENIFESVAAEWKFFDLIFIILYIGIFFIYIKNSLLLENQFL